ncbi:MAG: toll/interleukin-1 receptor domain-containing protein [Candidatus Thiodiazotropha sp. (ex Cardiolucina cf. quadrata)]|nr:toll/interleukin-1 receptor domain-containing protein [Candidatus Thiodiazotropha sp. (ex Cardiolucina cf. quadrata)]
MFSRVFISYRRADFGGHANLIVDRIREHLASHYGSHAIFLDTKSIPAGADFEAEISASMSIASAVIAVVGPDWINEATKRSGQVDHVVVELKSALSLGVPIVPLLAEGVSMPSAEVLPREISAFPRINAQTIGSGNAFQSSMLRLVQCIDSLAEAKEFRVAGFKARISEDERFGIKRFHIGDPERMSFRKFFELMASREDFQRFLSRLLRESGLSSFLFEMPPLSASNMDWPVEFVLLPIPLMTGSPDRDVYAEYFSWPEAVARGVVSFPNLGKDALLVVPVPAHDSSDYKDLRSFLSNAPLEQQDALWSELGSQVLGNVSDRIIWVSVAGGGIPWLHFRLDNEPKYYRYAPYRNR